MMTEIDVIDFKGDEWTLLAPPLRWNRPKTELWLLVGRRTDRIDGDLACYLEIPVPCFTEWWT